MFMYIPMTTQFIGNDFPSSSRMRGSMVSRTSYSYWRSAFAGITGFCKTRLLSCIPKYHGYIKTSFRYGLLALLCGYPFGLFAVEQLQSPYLNPQVMLMPQEIRDPFTPSDLMFQVFSQSSGRGAGGFMRSPVGGMGTGMPKMRLRGFIDQGDKEPLALLEVAGARTYLVREGDDISINPAQPNSVIRITKIDRLSITVEAGILGSIRVQR